MFSIEIIDISLGLLRSPILSIKSLFGEKIFGDTTPRPDLRDSDINRAQIVMIRKPASKMNATWTFTLSIQYWAIGKVGLAVGGEVGGSEGYIVGDSVVGWTEGNELGETDGKKVGATDGEVVGLKDGKSDGYDVGLIDGETDGYDVGPIEGTIVGPLLGP